MSVSKHNSATFFWSLGLGFWWSSFPIFGFKLYIAPEILDANPELNNLTWMCSLVALGFGLLFMLLIRTRIAPLCAHLKLLSLSTFFVCLGVVLCALAAQALLTPAYFLVGTLFLGFFTAPLMMSWSELIGVIGMRRSVQTIAGSILISGVYFMVASWLSTINQWFACGVLFCMPLLSLLFINMSWRVSREQVITVTRQNLISFHFPPRTLVGLFIFGSATGLVRVISSSMMPGEPIQSFLAFGIGIVIATAPFLLLFVAYPEKLGYVILFRATLPIIAGLLLSLVIIGPQFNVVIIVGFVGFVWGFQELFSMINSTIACSRLGTSSLMIFLQMACVDMLGAAFGMLVWYGYHDLRLFPRISPLLIVSFFVVALMFAGIFLLNEPGRTSIWGVTSTNATHLGKDSHSELDALAQQFSLTPRERDVLVLLARGRNADVISNELIISLYTARTHIKRIYVKCGVHSLQGLIDLVEAVRSRQ